MVLRKNQMRELRALASQDPLTGLANRRALLSALTAATASSPSDGRKHAFFLIDLNDFKRVNDLHGHALGDRVLQVVAERFRTAARPSDLLARLGGDEFAVLSYDVDRDTAHAIGLRFIATLANEIRVGGHLHEIGASIGAALIPDDGTTPEEIIHNADLAMYQAKGQDQNLLVFFEPVASHPGKSHRSEPDVSDSVIPAISGRLLSKPMVSESPLRFGAEGVQHGTPRAWLTKD